MSFIRINNRNNFLISEVPSIHPKSVEYLKYWKRHKRRVIEGFWSIDDIDTEINVDEDFPEGITSDKWRFMPSNLYFYVNFGIILHKPDDAPKSAPKEKIRPSLRDIEWEFFYNWTEAKGFSGFKDDDNYTCNRDMLMLFRDPYYKVDSTCYKKDGTLKDYVSARDYLRRLHSSNLGIPLWQNMAQDLFLCGPRGTGKSFLTGVGVVQHEIITDGAKEYTERTIKHPAKVEIFVGAAIAAKSSELLQKTQQGMDNLPGAWGENTDEYTPSPLYKQMSGDIKPNNMKSPWTHSYDKKVGGKWIKAGSKSNIKHGTYTIENPEAAAGGRYSTSVVEECGLLPNALAVHGCYAKGTKIRMYDGSLCNIEDITYSSEIMGHDGTLRTVKDIFNGKSQLYKIKQANGVEYIVNNRHKLYLEQAARKEDDGVYTVLAEDWYNNKDKKSVLRRKETYVLKSGSIDFKENKLKLDPYFMGLWLGDGVVKSSGICFDPKTDINTQEWLIDYYKSLDLNYSLRDVKGAILCCPVSKKQKPGSNIIRNLLKEYNTLYEKFLHPDFQLASRENRLKLLAGLIDSDGTLSKKNNGYKYVFYQSGREDMVDKIQFIARSLGFRVNCCTHIDTRKEHYKPRYQISITGNIGEIPCRHPRKKVPSDYKVVRNTVRTGFVLEKLDVGEYYGFELNEDFRFLGEDNRICENSNTATMMDFPWKFGAGLWIGTGGNVEKIQEFEIMFRDPKGFEALEFDDEWEGTGKIGWFFPAYYAMNEYKDENGNTDVEAATKALIKRREEKKKSKDPSALALEMMNYPIKPSEMFMNAKDNIFPQAELKSHLAEVVSNPHRYENAHYHVELVWDTEGKIKMEYLNSNLLERDYPIKDNKNREGVICLFELPIKDVEGHTVKNRYLQGTDTYDDDESITDSLGSTWILDSFTERIVAEYTGRRGTDEFYEITRKLNVFYSTEHNYEQNKKGLYSYYNNKNSTHLLCDTPESLRDVADITISKVGNKRKGTTMVTPVRVYGLRLLAKWLIKPAYGEDEDSNVLNLHKIESIGLLKELINFNYKRNADRISAMIILMILREDKLKYIETRKNKTIKSLGEDDFFNRNYNIHTKQYSI